MKCGGCNGTGKVPGCFMDWYPCGRCQPDVPKAEVQELKAAPMQKCGQFNIGDRVRHDHFPDVVGVVVGFIGQRETLVKLDPGSEALGCCARSNGFYCATTDWLKKEDTI